MAKEFVSKQNWKVGYKENIVRKWSGFRFESSSLPSHIAILLHDRQKVSSIKGKTLKENMTDSIEAGFAYVVEMDGIKPFRNENKVY